SHAFPLVGLGKERLVRGTSFSHDRPLGVELVESSQISLASVLEGRIGEPVAETLVPQHRRKAEILAERDHISRSKLPVEGLHGLGLTEVPGHPISSAVLGGKSL